MLWKTQGFIRKTMRYQESEEKKLNTLIEILRGLGSVVLAYSGGVDSTFLLKAISVSKIQALAVTSYSETMPEWDIKDSVFYASTFGIRHMIIKTDELKNKDFVRNTKERCFHCKDELFKELKKIASKEGYNAVVDGSTIDDLSDYRPGMRAKEMHGVKSPLIEAGFNKSDIRAYLKKHGISIWDKPSSPCLSSRIPYGTPITIDALKKVALSETYLRDLGFRELRVRHFGKEARVEISEEEIQRAFEKRKEIVEGIKELGYDVVCLDLEGFKSGKLNLYL